MTLALSPPFDGDEVPPPAVLGITVDHCHQLIARGVLGEDDPSELLEGWVVPKMPRTPRHNATTDLASDTLRAILPAGWRVRSQSAVTTSDSEPEPDIAVVAGTARDYARRHPRPDDIALLVEIADSSLEQDKSTKARIYARAGVPAYWEIDL